MRLRFRRLRPGETDHELIWFAVGAAAWAGGWAWLALGLPRPGCPFSAATGIPCAGCGATRCFAALLAGDWMAAFEWNPLAAAALSLAVPGLLYAGLAAAFRLPRLRAEGCGGTSGRTARAARATAWLLLAANWIYLILRD
jgi:hypothetical protein